MRREDLVDLIGRISPHDHPKLHLVLRSGVSLAADAFIRFEEHYATIRGREAGNTDENRGFFVPYDEIQFMKLERVVKSSELSDLYGDEPHAVDQPVPMDGSDVETPPPAAAPALPPVEVLSPAEIAKQNLLERIRAARSLAGPRVNGK